MCLAWIVCGYRLNFLERGFEGNAEVLEKLSGSKREFNRNLKKRRFTRIRGTGFRVIDAAKLGARRATIIVGAQAQRGFSIND